MPSFRISTGAGIPEEHANEVSASTLATINGWSRNIGSLILKVELELELNGVVAYRWLSESRK